jgi:hypothetical protein
MAAFAAGRTSVLVATTVIEVGVNVPNASIMVIEQAESFGLAQLHQLRGRVGRGAAASTCLLIYRAPLGETARRRLETLRETEDGFRIAEVDLELRGAGDVLGTVQSGLPRFRVADLERQAALMQVARSDARKLLSDDPALTSDRGRAARVLLWLTEQDRAPPRPPPPAPAGSRRGGCGSRARGQHLEPVEGGGGHRAAVQHGAQLVARAPPPRPGCGRSWHRPTTAAAA